MRGGAGRAGGRWACWRRARRRGAGRVGQAAAARGERRARTAGEQQQARKRVAGAPGARHWRAAGRTAGPTGCALGALSLFLARFDSVLFLSQIFGHCS